MREVGKLGPFSDLTVMMLRGKRESMVDNVGVAGDCHCLSVRTGTRVCSSPSRVFRIERVQTVRIYVENGDQITPLPENRHYDLRPRSRITGDVSRIFFDVADDHRLSSSRCISTHTSAERDVDAAEASLIWADTKELTRLDHTIEARPSDGRMHGAGVRRSSPSRRLRHRRHRGSHPSALAARHRPEFSVPALDRGLFPPCGYCAVASSG